jgi:hypothetical protein
MSETDKEDSSNYLSAADMRDWAQRELKDVSKALELRLRELNDLVARYSAGELSAEKADELRDRYFHRWGESLPGHSASENVSDEQLLAGVDAAADAVNGPFVTPAETHARYVRLRKGGAGPHAGKLR